jgi:protein involved in sex pheromone biosynthesis
MKNKLVILALASVMGLLVSCAGNQAPKQGNDTVSKADATKDTLGIDTNKNGNKDNTIKTSTDTVKKAIPKQ